MRRPKTIVGLRSEATFPPRSESRRFGIVILALFLTPHERQNYTCCRAAKEGLDGRKLPI